VIEVKLLFVGAAVHNDACTSTPPVFDVSEPTAEATTASDDTWESHLRAPFPQLRCLNLAQNKVLCLLTSFLSLDFITLTIPFSLLL